MNKLFKGKNSLLLALTAGIVGFSAYGTIHTVQTFNNIDQAQISGYSLTTNLSSDNLSLVPGEGSCNPLGCAACSGCVSKQYIKNIEALPSSNTQIGQTY
jgi:hypothetical protein